MNQTRNNRNKRLRAATPADPNRAVGYVRVSTDEQGDKGGPIRQRQSIEQWGRANGIEIVGLVEDFGTSGGISPSQRQYVREAIEVAEMCDARGIVVAEADRWTRGGIEDSVLSRAWLAQEHGMILHYADLPFGMDKMFGDIILAVRDAMAAEWLRQHKDRVKRGLADAKDKDWPNGKPGGQPKPCLTLTELDHVLNLMDAGSGGRTIANEVSKARGAYERADVKRQSTIKVTETWVREQLQAKCKSNPAVRMRVERRWPALLQPVAVEGGKPE